MAPRLLSTDSSSPDPAPRHWAARRAVVALRIEEAALTLFLDRSPDEVTAEEIAEAAGISRRTFFRYFPSRDDVLGALPMRVLVEAVEVFRARPADESILDALVATARREPLVAESHAMLRLSAQVMAKAPEAWTRALTRVSREAHALFADAVAHRLRAAGRDAREADLVGAALIAISVQAYRNWLADNCAGVLAEHLEPGLRQLSEIASP